jgi:hypothetical protein
MVGHKNISQRSVLEMGQIQETYFLDFIASKTTKQAALSATVLLKVITV